MSIYRGKKNTTKLYLWLRHATSQWVIWAIKSYYSSRNWAPL